MLVALWRTDEQREPKKELRQEILVLVKGETTVDWTRAVYEITEEWLDSGYMLKVELTEFANSIDVEWEKKRE